VITSVVDCQVLSDHLDDAGWKIFDCRFDLADPPTGRAAYLASHIPGAVYVDLEADLSGPPVTDHGRHPLPAPAALTDLFSRLGICEGVQVVAYDDAGGLTAARLWWLLRYMGHTSAAVLDGGWRAWCEAGLPVSNSLVAPRPARFAGTPRRELLVTVGEVSHAPLLIDARAPARYQGEHEPIDPVAGHIPGARNHHCLLNLDARGRLRPPAELREAFTTLLDGCTALDAVMYCGSGVTACHNLLAMHHAGLGDARLYAGSWSEWCADPRRPVARAERVST
jgi:thiosulfate/3-mercaptopyruvate sulfurtransferase